VAWRYRKSKRLPLGIRMNLSKSGLGFSWGFRGFRIGRDSKGRVTRTVSVPGTGIYNRQVIRPQSQQRGGQVGPAWSPTRSSVVVVVLLFLFIFVCATSFGAFSLAIISLLLGGFICFGMIRQTHVAQVQAAPVQMVAPVAGVPAPPLQVASRNQNSSVWPQVSASGQSRIAIRETIDSLASEIKSFVDEIELPLKEELRKHRGARGARILLEGDIQRLIVRSGFDGTKFSVEAVDLYLSLSRRLHPKTYSAFTPDTMADVLNRMVNNDKKYYFPPDIKLFTLRYLEGYDSANGTQFAAKASGMFLKIPGCAAVENNVVSDAKKEVLSNLSSACGNQ